MSTMKKCQVVMLPTNQKTNIIKRIRLGHPEHTRIGEILLIKDREINPHYFQCQHLYFLSDEDIKKGDWYLNNSELSKGIRQCMLVSFDRLHSKQMTLDRLSACKKIIATTDSSLELINSKHDKRLHDTYLPQPSQAFLEVFVREYNKGNVIKEVMVEYGIYKRKSNSLERDAIADIIGYAQEELLNSLDEDIITKLKVNPKDNTITIKRVKDSWNREETEEKCKLAYLAGYDMAKGISKLTSKEWIEQNL